MISHTMTAQSFSYERRETPRCCEFGVGGGWALGIFNFTKPHDTLEILWQRKRLKTDNYFRDFYGRSDVVTSAIL